APLRVRHSTLNEPSSATAICVLSASCPLDEPHGSARTVHVRPSSVDVNNVAWASSAPPATFWKISAYAAGPSRSNCTLLPSSGAAPVTLAPVNVARPSGAVENANVQPGGQPSDTVLTRTTVLLATSTPSAWPGCGCQVWPPSVVRNRAVDPY